MKSSAGARFWACENVSHGLACDGNASPRLVENRGGAFRVSLSYNASNSLKCQSTWPLGFRSVRRGPILKFQQAYILSFLVRFVPYTVAGIVTCPSHLTSHQIAEAKDAQLRLGFYGGSLH